MHHSEGNHPEDSRQSVEEALFSGVLRLNGKILGLVLGILLGLAIFIATNWLVIKGGHITPSGEYVVGPELRPPVALMVIIGVLIFKPTGLFGRSGMR